MKESCYYWCWGKNWGNRWGICTSSQLRFEDKLLVQATTSQTSILITQHFDFRLPQDKHKFNKHESESFFCRISFFMAWFVAKIAVLSRLLAKTLFYLFLIIEDRRDRRYILCYTCTMYNISKLTATLFELDFLTLL